MNNNVKHNINKYASNSRIRKSNIREIISRDFFFSISSIIFIVFPIYVMSVAPFPENLMLLIFVSVGVIILSIVLRDIYKYGIKKEPYEFYIISSGYGDNRTRRKYMGNQIGLPNRFCDLTESEEKFLEIGIYDSRTSIQEQINYASSNYQELNAQKKKKAKFSKMINIIILSIFLFMGAPIILTLFGYADAINIFLNIRNYFFVIFIVFIILVIIASILGDTTRQKKKQNNNVKNDCYNNENSKYYIENDDDPFANFDKNNSNK